MAYFNNDEIYRYFERAIKKAAVKNIDKTKKEINYITAKEGKKINEELELKKSIALARGMQAINAEHQEKINEIGADYNAKLILERDKMADLIFDDVKKQILKFIGSNDYVKLMTNKLKALNSKIKGKTLIKVGSSDKKILGILNEVITKKYELEKSDEIKYGGFSLLLIDEGVEIDETIDNKLESQIMWFYDNSRLFVKN